MTRDEMLSPELDEIPLDAAVLVAVVTQPRDLALAREQGWYRIPLCHAPNRLAVEYLAFYQTARFAEERWAVRWFAAVRQVSLMTRAALLPHESQHPRANQLYYRFALGSLQALPLPVPSRRLRRVTFIPTTYGQLLRARDVTELWTNQEPAADSIWGGGVGRQRSARRSTAQPS